MPDNKVETRMPDPFRSYKFVVTAANLQNSKLGFQKVTGLKEASDVVEYREGSDPIWKRKLPGLTNYDPVTFSRGAANTEAIIGWRKKVAVAQSKGEGVTNFRDEITVQLFDRGSDETSPSRTWTIQNAWPMELNYSDLNAEGSEILIESLVMANEGILAVNK